MKIVVNEKPTSGAQCPFRKSKGTCTGGNWTWEDVCSLTQPATCPCVTNSKAFDFDKCPYCIVLTKEE